MRRCYFVWSDKVQMKPSGLHRLAAVFSIVAQPMNVGLCDAWLVLNIRGVVGGMLGVGTIHTVLRCHPVFGAAVRCV